jgi:predicted DCC family thiol-disulfide oxidoreductase YuxK
MTNPTRTSPLPPAGFPELGGSDLLLYDGECRFCQAASARLMRMAGPHLRRVSLHEPGLLAALGLDHDAVMKAMHLVTPEGRVYLGLEALVQALRHRRVLGAVVKAYYIPGIRQLSDLGYRLVARYRYALMGRAVAAGQCDSGTCHLHARPH